MKKSPEQKAKRLLDQFNDANFRLHKEYEELFWISYMGDHGVDKKKDAAMAARDAFRANPIHGKAIRQLLPKTPAAIQARLNIWLDFFDIYQTPAKALAIKDKISKLESRILQKRSKQKEGYIDPQTKKFVAVSMHRMQTMGYTHPDEKIRKACYKAVEALPMAYLGDYVKLIGLRNAYAHALGYADFYDYKLRREDRTTKQELFSLFDSIYKKTKYAFRDIRKMEKAMPGLRKPWNFGYMMAGDFTKEEDPYFQFDDAMLRWGKSFAALGVDFRGGKLQLDLCDRPGKWNNGFCHWPDLVTYKNGKRLSGSSNFTCNVAIGQPGAGYQGYHTLFHEGGHAAHLLNSNQQENCLSTEYAPATAFWDETQSMFMDAMFGGIEWRQRYALNPAGESYPLELFQRRAKKLQPLRPLGLHGVLFVSNFERAVYEEPRLTQAKVMNLAKKMYRKYYDRTEDSLYALTVPHLYNWESSASYHGYGLASLAVSQWREYFYKKYGYIVDNKNVGREMAAVWKFGSAKDFNACVRLATGKKLSADSWLKNISASLPTVMARAKKRIARLKKVPRQSRPIRLNAKIKMVDGKKTIADNKKSFEDMAAKYAAWYLSRKPKPGQ